MLGLGAAFVAAGLLPRESLTSFVLYVTFISDASSDVADQWGRIQVYSIKCKVYLTGIKA